MPAPSLLQVYPANSDTGIPVGISLEVVFDKGIDLNTAKDNVVLYGADFDLTSGPESATWIDQETANNPYFLRSPGFQGLVELSARVVYVDISDPAYPEVTPASITSEADESAQNIGHKLILTPKEQLAPDVIYNFYVMGDPDAAGRGISSRTVFDVVPDGANTGNGSMLNYGGYTGASADEVVIEFMVGGDIGTAKYRWYYAGAGVGTAISGRVTSRRYRRLADGLQVRFDGDGFVAGDIFRFNVEPIERLAVNTNVSFTTNDGSYTAAPTSPSTPAPSTAPASTIPPAPGASSGSSASSTMFLEEMIPYDRSYNIDVNNRTITIVFDSDLDATTITDETVTLCALPILGLYGQQTQPNELNKKLTVSGNTLIIEF